ncbi:MAG TPA: single-stranded DNA-binding protein [Abditibacteriaceae bacterium]|jgi:single-strand DNA-binding protein
MPSFNRVVLIGRLTRDPELRYTAGGLAITKFSIAVDRRFKNQQGERVTDFFDCSAFRQTAEFVANYVNKGRLVAVDGRIEMNQSTGQDGQKRYFTNIICDTVETLDSQRDGAADGGGAPMGAAGMNAGGMGAGAGGMTSGGTSGGQRGGPPAGGMNAGADADNGYFPDDDMGAPPARPPRPPQGGAVAAGGRGGASGGAAAGGATGGGARPQPAAPAYPDDDFDDSDPFADQ